MYLLPLSFLLLALAMVAAAWFGKRSLAVVLAVVLGVALIVVGSAPAGAAAVLPPAQSPAGYYLIPAPLTLFSTYNSSTCSIAGSYSLQCSGGALGSGLAGGGIVTADQLGLTVYGIVFTMSAYSPPSNPDRPFRYRENLINGPGDSDLVVGDMYCFHSTINNADLDWLGCSDHRYGSFNSGGTDRAGLSIIHPQSSWSWTAADFAWIVKTSTTTLTPSPSPTVANTATPTQTSYGGGFGTHCVDDEPFQWPVSPTPGGPSVDATYIIDGSFEAMSPSSPPVAPWYNVDGYAGGVVGDGLPYSRLGSNAMVQYYYHNTTAATGFGQTVYLPAATDYIVIGWSARGGETAGTRILEIRWKNEAVWSEPISGIPWQDYEIETDSNGGIGNLEFIHYPGDGTVYIDAIYLYAYDEPAGGGVPVIICVEELGTPTPLSTVPPLSTAGPTPTPGDIWATPIDPGGGMTPQATSCYGWPNVDYPDPPSIGGVDLPGEIPGVDLCIQPQLLVIGDDNPIRQVMDPDAFFLTLMGFGVVAAIVTYIRQR